jgi:hypothetical protein
MTRRYCIVLWLSRLYDLRNLHDGAERTLRGTDLLYKFGEYVYNVTCLLPLLLLLGRRPLI